MNVSFMNDENVDEIFSISEKIIFTAHEVCLLTLKHLRYLEKII